MTDKQHTIKDSIFFEGIGLHTGTYSKIEISPAPPNNGITFVRKDLSSSPIIKIDIDAFLSAKNFQRRTSIGRDGVYIHTIEHLMAAFHILNIDNVKINIWGEEIPGLDGSSKEFVEQILKVGIEEQDVIREYVLVKDTIHLEENSASIVVLPYPTLRISYFLKYDNPLIGSEYEEVNFSSEDCFLKKIYEARTFCLEEEAKNLLEMGLGKGANYKNTLVVTKDCIKDNDIRIENEFAKHKILDLIGDLYLIGPIKAYIIAIRSGHTLNIKLLEKLYNCYKKKEKTQSKEVFSQFLDNKTLNIEEILKILPHRYPFLLVDRIIYLDKGKRGIGIKNVTYNEYFFKGHFVQKPVMPGVLILEAMAQVAGIVIGVCYENEKKLAYLASVDTVKFRKIVQPGDQLVIEVDVKKIKSKIGLVYAKTLVDNEIIAEAELMLSLG
ncbi:MAG: UDP-3-O-acyl-N-acetylglucosamine deacetylase [Candidatus Omnitrophica bacterium]|nr:UDP-3-O-acyl-N-acetylglucosamine deacetylase [Candidatus Omnitrophota bacterium]MCM8831128.1 UDP-3-O-acyl-N-acetylglucosamine deacetylase [Candidatus Omnitrophota bacterium]